MLIKDETEEDEVEEEEDEEEKEHYQTGVKPYQGIFVSLIIITQHKCYHNNLLCNESWRAVDREKWLPLK